MQESFCPFMSDSQCSKECAKENCAVYNEKYGACSMLVLANSAKEIANQVESLRSDCRRD